MSAEASKEYISYMITWIVKLPILAFIMLIMTGMITAHINRTYDTHELEFEIVKDRITYCITHNIFETLEQDCLDEPRYAAKITREEQEVIINQELYKNRILCTVTSPPHCTPQPYTFTINNKHYTLDIILNGETHA